MAIKYVRATGGSDANNGSSFALGWATLAYAFSGSNANRVAAGDTLAVCGDTVGNVFTLTTAVTPDFTTTQPSYAVPVYIAGYNMSGVQLTNGNFVKITTSTNLATGLFNMAATASCKYLKFTNILFNGNGSGGAAYAIYSSNYTVNQGMVFDNCRFTNCASYGLYVQTPVGIGAAWKFLQCEIDNNGKGGGSGGIAGWASTYGSFIMVGCKIHDNNGPGVQYGDTGYFFDNLIYKNLGDGITNTYVGSNNLTSVFENNVIFGNTGDGLDLYATTPYPISIVNNIFRSNGQYGIRTNSADVDYYLLCLVANNCSHNNTSGHIDINGGVFPGVGNIYKNPLFVSETAGSEDFTLQSTSPCRSSGFNPLGY